MHILCLAGKTHTIEQELKFNIANLPQIFAKS